MWRWFGCPCRQWGSVEGVAYTAWCVITPRGHLIGLFIDQPTGWTMAQREGAMQSASMNHFNLFTGRSDPINLQGLINLVFLGSLTIDELAFS
jgi:hypothetical protein